jgi:cell division septum initiation protein DivIVA
MGGNSLNEKAAGETTFPHNEKRIQRVLEIERQAQAIREAALRAAEQLPIQAEQEAQTLIEKARADAEEEARQSVANAQAQAECARILAQAEEESRRLEALAMSHFDHAVGFVLDRVTGRE